ncbi:MDR family MFS transporter [Streptomyces fuscigenes]|uniref:MDR family MFS transporter n=1 Tax=Streptomyces fuscigenes TaxID=1528880 RepID=UPI001F4122F0|nr:MFS transporter [Streptomyces fuscigenes]MCF3960508.1 MFS transporter [Streptomyces fuscigenes]
MSTAGAGRAVRESVAGLPRAFWWLWTSTLVNRLGAFVATFMALYLTVERGYSASYAGLVASLYGLGGVIASLGGGVLADRLGRRPTMLVAQCATAASVALLGLMANPVAIAAVACLVGMASSASRPAVQAMMADIVRPEDRVRAFSLNYWAINLGFAVSSALAGFVAQYSYRAGFFGEAAMTLLCAVVVYTKLPESRPGDGSGPGSGARARDGRAGTDRSRSGGDGGGVRAGGEAPVSMLSVVRDGRFMSVVALSFVVALIFQQGSVGLPVAMGEAGFTSAEFGTAMAANGLLIVALQIPVTRFIQHRDPRRLLVVSSLLAGYGFGLTMFAGSLGVYVLTVVVWTLAEIVNAPTQTGLVVRLSPVQGRGRYQGMYSMSWSVAALVAPLMSGTVLDRWGARWLWGACAVLGTLAALGYWLLMRGLPQEDGVAAGGLLARKSLAGTGSPAPAAPVARAECAAAPVAATGPALAEAAHAASAHADFTDAEFTDAESALAESPEPAAAAGEAGTGA